MGHFDDSSDPELGAAANRLDAFGSRFSGADVIDAASGLTSADVDRILTVLYRIRRHSPSEIIAMNQMGRRGLLARS